MIHLFTGFSRRVSEAARAQRIEDRPLRIISDASQLAGYRDVVTLHICEGTDPDLLEALDLYLKRMCVNIIRHT